MDCERPEPCHSLGQGQLCNASVMDERGAAQAAEFVRALRDQLHEMIHELVRLEGQDVTSTSRASAIRCAAAALRRDINEAQTLIDRLQRRYLKTTNTPRPADL
jgi:hypothetical protein